MMRRREVERLKQLTPFFFPRLQYWLFSLFGANQALVPELGIVKKERGEGQYRLSAYAAAKCVAEFFLDLANPVLFSCILYWTTNMNPDAYRFFTFLAVLLWAHLLGQASGHFIAAWVPNIQKSSSIILIGMFVCTLTASFYANIDAIPAFFAWVTYVNPLRYLFDALIINEFDDDVVYTDDDGSDITGRSIVEASDPIIWGGEWAGVWLNVLVVIGMTIIFRVMAYYFLHRRTDTKLRMQ
jgi:ABC-type multidrug transport system permease subunit